MTTASITPVANRPVLLAVASSKGPGTAATPTVSGCNLTWTKIREQTYSTVNVAKLSVWLGFGTAPTTGVVTIDWSAESQTFISWAVDSFQNGTAGAGFAVQSVGNSAAAGSTSVTATMGAFGSTSNGSYGAVGVVVNTGVTPGSGFAELADAPSAGALGLETEWRNDNDTSIDATFLSSAAGIIGIEIQLDATGPTATTWAATANGLSVTALLSEPGCIPASGTGGFSVDGTFVTGWTIIGTTLTLTLARPTPKSRIINVQYTSNQTATPITDPSGNPMASFGATAVSTSGITLAIGDKYTARTRRAMRVRRTRRV